MSNTGDRNYHLLAMRPGAGMAATACGVDGFVTHAGAGATPDALTCPECRVIHAQRNHARRAKEKIISDTRDPDTDQVLPTPNDRPYVQDMVIADVETRKALGIRKYGTALQSGNGRDMLRDAYDEVLDLAIYIRGEIDDRERTPTVAEQVREFHETYGHAIRDTPTPDVPEAQLRVDLIEEEAREHSQATEDGDLVEIVDALADLVYVAYGAALCHGVDLDDVIAEVHRSNMSKLGADGQPIVRADGKILKGPNYFKPDIARVLREQTAAAEKEDQ